jgi:hypothetical protein
VSKNKRSPPPKNERAVHLVPIERWPVAFSAGDETGTYQYLCRLFGIVAKVSVSPSRWGPRVRLYGTLVARRPDVRCEAPIVLVPVALADRVSKEFAAHPPNSTRDRVRVWIDYDLWAVKTASIVGVDIVCNGNAWVPEPIAWLEAISMGRAFPKSPSEYPR